MFATLASELSMMTTLFCRNDKRLPMKRAGGAFLAISLLVLAACVHSLTLQSRDGEQLSGRYRFGTDDSGLIQITGPGDELLNGRFVRVARATFVKNYEKTFGQGSIAVYEPDAADYGIPFAGVFGSSSVLTDVAHGETFNKGAGKSEVTVRGPLFYWTASLQSKRGATMECYLIGSSYTGHGFGKCKSESGHEYSVDF